MKLPSKKILAGIITVLIIILIALIFLIIKASEVYMQVKYGTPAEHGSSY